MSRIFIKKQDAQLRTDSLSFFCELSPLDLLSRLTAENAPASIAGMMTSENGAVDQCLFTVEEQKLCRFPLRNDGTIFPTYRRFNDQYVLEITPRQIMPMPMSKRPTALTEELFSEEEKKELRGMVASQPKTQLKWQIKLPIENSPLSKSQQEILCYGIVLVAQQPFLTLLNDSLCSLDEKEQIDALQAIIAQDSIRQQLFEKYADMSLKAATAGVVFEAFSPDRVNQLSKTLFSTEGSYHPTIGDVIHFFTSCIQQLLGKNALLESNLQMHALPDDILKLSLGAHHQFNREDIYNEVGLRGESALIFDFIASIIHTQNNAELPLITPEIEPLLPQLSLILEDIIKAIEAGGTTQLIEYNEIYNNLLAAFPGDNGFSGWKNKKARLQEMASSIFLKNLLSVLPDNASQEEKESMISTRLALHNFQNNVFCASAFLTLRRAGILNPENWSVVLRHLNPASLADAFVVLHRAGIFTSENCSTILRSSNPASLANVLVKLHQEGVLTPENRFDISLLQSYGLSHIELFANASVTLNQAGIYTPENRTAILRSSSPESLANALVKLNQAGIYTPENHAAILRSSRPESLANAFVKLNQAGVLTPENCSAVSRQDPDSFTDVFFILYQAGVPAPGQRCMLFRYKKLVVLKNIFTQLNQANPLTAEACNKVLALRHDYFEAFLNILTILNQTGVLNADRCEQLLKLLPEDHSSIRGLSGSLSVLHRANSLNLKNINALLERKGDFSMMFDSLNRAGILTPENSVILLSAENPVALQEAFVILHKAGILSDENRSALIMHAYPPHLAEAFDELHRAGILNDEYRSMVLSHRVPSSLAKAFSILHKADILNDENRSALIMHEYPSDPAAAFDTLHRAGILNDEYRSMVLSHKDSASFAKAFNILHKANILDPIDRSEVLKLAEHPSLSNLLAILINLDEAAILTSENYSKVFAHKETEFVVVVLDLMERMDCATIDNQYLNRILAYDEIESLCHVMRVGTDNNSMSPQAYQIIWEHQSLSSVDKALGQLWDAFNIYDLTKERYCAILQHPEPEKYVSFLIAFKKISDELLPPFIQKLQKYYEEKRGECAQNEMDGASKLGQILQSVCDDKAISPEKIYQVIEGVKRVIGKEVTPRSSIFFSGRKSKLTDFYNEGLKLLVDIKTKTSSILELNDKPRTVAF